MILLEDNFKPGQQRTTQMNQNYQGDISINQFNVQVNEKSIP